MIKPRVEVTILGEHRISVDRGRVDVSSGNDFLNPTNEEAQTMLLVALLEELQALRHEVSWLRKEMRAPL